MPFGFLKLLLPDLVLVFWFSLRSIKNKTKQTKMNKQQKIALCETNLYLFENSDPRCFYYSNPLEKIPPQLICLKN